MAERRAATTIGELDTHLSYVQEDLAGLKASMQEMATRQDIERLTARMGELATKEELRRVEAKITEESVGGRFEKLANIATKLLAVVALCTAIWGGVVAIVHIGDQLQVIKKQP